MAELTKVGTPSICTPVPPTNSFLNEMLAGEAIAAGDACYLKSDGKLWKATGAALNAAARVKGLACKAASVGEAVTLVNDVNMEYGSGMTPGTDFYLSATVAGGLADAATTGGVNPIAYAVSATRIHIFPIR